MRKDVIYKDSMTQTKGMDMTLLLAHAEDHLMTAILAKDLITEMIEHLFFLSATYILWT